MVNQVNNFGEWLIEQKASAQKVYEAIKEFFPQAYLSDEPDKPSEIHLGLGKIGLKFLVRNIERAFRQIRVDKADKLIVSSQIYYIFFLTKTGDMMVIRADEVYREGRKTEAYKSMYYVVEYGLVRNLRAELKRLKNSWEGKIQHKITEW